MTPAPSKTIATKYGLKCHNYNGKLFIPANNVAAAAQSAGSGRTLSSTTTSPQGLMKDKPRSFKEPLKNFMDRLASGYPN
jgi:hypothetical protein